MCIGITFYSFIWYLLEHVLPICSASFRKFGSIELAFPTMYGLFQKIIFKSMTKSIWLQIYQFFFWENISFLAYYNWQGLNFWYMILFWLFNIFDYQRRWIVVSNPSLCAVISKWLGTEAWVRNIDLLAGLRDYASDADLQQEWRMVRKWYHMQILQIESLLVYCFNNGLKTNSNFQCVGEEDK